MIPCVVLAGGLGTRMRDITGPLPKALVPVLGRPFVEHQLEWLAAEGVPSVVLCIGHQGGLLREHVGDGRSWGLDVTYVDEGADLRGTAGALRLALDAGALPETFLLVYGDAYLPVPFDGVLAAFRRAGMPALMTVFRNEGRWGPSNARYNDGRVTRYRKGHPDPEAAGMPYIDYGISVLNRDVVAEEVPAATTADLADVFHRLSEEGRLAGLEVHERFYEVGSPSGLVDLEAYLAGRAGAGSAPRRPVG